MIKGTVIAVTRSASVCSVQLVGGTTITATYLNGMVPPPRSVVFCEDVGNGSWLVLGSIGNRLIVAHDDFTSDVSAGASGAIGDQNWFQIGTAGGMSNQSASDMVGLLQIATNAVAGQAFGISKGGTGNVVPNTDALWFSSRFSIPSITTVVVTVGFATNGVNINGAPGVGQAAAVMLFDTGIGANWQLRTVNNATDVKVDTGVSATTTTVDMDLIMVGGTIATLWINGQGPYVQRVGANIPPSSSLTQAPQPVASVFTGGAVQRFLNVDWIHVERVSGLNLVGL